MSAVERLVCRELGVERVRAQRLVAAMRARRAPHDYWARVALFAAGVSPLGRLLGKRRRAAVAPFLYKLLDRPADVMYMLGVVDEPVTNACRGLLSE